LQHELLSVADPEVTQGMGEFSKIKLSFSLAKYDIAENNVKKTVQRGTQLRLPPLFIRHRLLFTIDNKEIEKLL